jgi:hypothetical protein
MWSCTFFSAALRMYASSWSASSRSGVGDQRGDGGLGGGVGVAEQGQDKPAAPGEAQRHRNARTARKSYRFNKEFLMHEPTTYLTMYGYNFCWPARAMSK